MMPSPPRQRPQRQISFSLVSHQQRCRSRCYAQFDAARCTILSSAVWPATAIARLYPKSFASQLLRLRRAALNYSQAAAKSP